MIDPQHNSRKVLEKRIQCARRLRCGLKVYKGAEFNLAKKIINDLGISMRLVEIARPLNDND